MLSEHSATGHALTMLHLQAKRPTLWDMEADLKKFKPPLLVLVGDEDGWCLDSSVFLQAHRADRRACGHPALRPHHHQRGARRVQCRGRPDLIAAAEAGQLAGAQAGGVIMEPFRARAVARPLCDDRDIVQPR